MDFKDFCVAFVIERVKRFEVPALRSVDREHGQGRDGAAYSREPVIRRLDAGREFRELRADAKLIAHGALAEREFADALDVDNKIGAACFTVHEYLLV